MFSVNAPSNGIPLPPHHAMVSISLAPYINAYHAESPDFDNLRNDLSSQLNGIQGHYLWIQMIEHAIIGLTDEECLRVLSSSIHEVLQEQFVEIVKNSMNEAIKGYYAHSQNLNVIILLKLDVSNPHKISITITDNGTGFSDLFLKNMADRDAQNDYIRTTNTPSLKHPEKTQAPLFKGKGSGLRFVLADFLQGDALENHSNRVHHANRPNSSASFYNHPVHHGAVITLTTASKTPSPFMDFFNESTEDSLDETTAPGLESGMHAGRNHVCVKFKLDPSLRALATQSKAI